MTDSKKQMDLDEILGAFVDIAKHGEGADRFRALKVLKELQQETGQTGLPDPMSDDEQYERLARLMKATGPAGCQFSYRKAFPSSRTKLKDSVPKVLDSDLVIDETKLPNTLKKLYKMFPYIKQHGFPKGYPLTKGLEAQKRFCNEKARIILREREQERLIAAAEADKETIGVPEDAPKD